LNNDSDLLGALDSSGSSEPLYSPFHRLDPYPQYLVVNIYGGYTLLSNKSICITNADQMETAQRLQAALLELGTQWTIKQHSDAKICENIGVQFELKPLPYGESSFEIEIQVYGPEDVYYKNGIISLIANDLIGLEQGVKMLIQVIHLSLEIDEESLVSLWIKNWPTIS
jgi:hypothetical protein